MYILKGLRTLLETFKKNVCYGRVKPKDTALIVECVLDILIPMSEGQEIKNQHTALRRMQTVINEINAKA
jgi:hypothetical protein